MCGECPANSEVFHCVNNCTAQGMCCLPQLPYTAFSLAVNTCPDMSKSVLLHAVHVFIIIKVAYFLMIIYYIYYRCSLF